MNKKIKYFFLTIGLVIIALIVYQLVQNFLPDIQAFIKLENAKEKALLMKSVRSHGFSTGILLVLLLCLFSAIPGFPVAVIGVLVGLCYGPLIGSLINILGNVLGNSLVFYLIPKFKLIDKSKASNHWVKIISEAKHPYLSLTFGYMIPMIPTILVNYTASLLKIPWQDFIKITLIGVLPTSIIYAFGGDALFKGHTKTSLILIASVLVFALLIVLIDKNRRQVESK